MLAVVRNSSGRIGDWAQVCLGAYVAEFLVVSHRWDTASTPDPLGVQLEVLVSFLRANPQIRYVNYDFMCVESDQADMLTFSPHVLACFPDMCASGDAVQVFCTRAR